MSIHYVLIIAISMPVSGGGVAVTHVPFGTKASCEAAAQHWNGKRISPITAGANVVAACHSVGPWK
jgi:hypothetical protein